MDGLLKKVNLDLKLVTYGILALSKNGNTNTNTYTNTYTNTNANTNTNTNTNDNIRWYNGICERFRLHISYFEGSQINIELFTLP